MSGLVPIYVRLCVNQMEGVEQIRIVANAAIQPLQVTGFYKGYVRVQPLQVRPGRWGFTGANARLSRLGGMGLLW